MKGLLIEMPMPKNPWQVTRENDDEGFVYFALSYKGAEEGKFHNQASAQEICDEMNAKYRREHAPR